MKKLLTRIGWTRMACLSVLLAAPLAAATVQIYALNNGSTTVDVIDAATNKIVMTIQGVPRPHDATFSPDGKLAYIASETDHALYVVDTKTGKHIKKVALSDGPGNVPTLTKDGKRLFVCVMAGRDKNGLVLQDGPGAVDVIDTTTFEKIKSLPMRRGMHDCYTTPDGKYIIGGMFYGKTVVVIDAKTAEVAWEVPLDHEIATIAIEAAPDGSTSRLFVDLQEVFGFSVVDFKQKKEVARIKFPAQPSGFLVPPPLERRNVIPTHGSTVSPDGKILAVATRAANGMYLYSLPSLKIMGFVSAPTVAGAKFPQNGSDPGWLTFTPDSKTIYLANGADDSVSVIDVKSMKETTRIKVGKQPDHVDTLVIP